MHFFSAFFAGAFLCNALPHLVAGLQGAQFPTPFAQPRGVGNSPPLVNFLWGMVNVVAGVTLAARHPIEIGINLQCAAILAGALAIGTYLALHFAKARGG